MERVPREAETTYTVESVTSFYDQFDLPEDDEVYWFPQYVLDTYGDY